MIRMAKRRNPTMKKRRRSAQLLEEPHQQSVEKLMQEFRNLENDWNSFNGSKPGPLRRSSSQSNAIVKTLKLLSNSPRSLMSSLQIRVRSNDTAREEILRDRKAAIESGKLRRRRLFEEVECETEVGFGEREEICSGSSYDNEGKGSCGGSKEEVVSGYCVCCCHSGSGSCLFDERGDGGEVVVVGGEKVVEERDEVSIGDGGGRWMVLKGWLSIVLMVFAIGVIYMRCNGGHGDEDEVMLVPT